MKKYTIAVIMALAGLVIIHHKISAGPWFSVNSYLEEMIAPNDTTLLVIHEYRGDIQWEKSSDLNNWIEIGNAQSDTLYIEIDSLAYYRAKVTEGTCLPVYSDTILITDSSNKKVTPQLGDTLTVFNHNNDLITLIIPPYALQDTTTITMVPLFSAPENPIAKNIFPGVRILPDSLRLLKSATLKVDLTTGLTDTSMSALFYLQNDSLAYPLANQMISTHSIQGEIYHFSSYIGGEPSGEEITGQTDNVSNSGSSNPFDWQSTFTVVEGLLHYSQSLTMVGNTDAAEDLNNMANQILANDAGKFLKEPIPENPCGWYLQMVFRYAEKVCYMIGGDLAQQFSDRIGELMDLCSFRGEIEFDHQITFSMGSGYEYTWEITGFVPFSIETKEYTTITGSGFVDHTISGHAEVCEITGSGVMPVIITGELAADEVGFPWLEMTFHETMFEGYGVTYVCPEYTYESPQSVAYPEPTVRFLPDEGFKVIVPVVAPGATGSYVYIMHIQHLPQ